MDGAAPHTEAGRQRGTSASATSRQRLHARSNGKSRSDRQGKKEGVQRAPLVKDGGGQRARTATASGSVGANRVTPRTSASSAATGKERSTNLGMEAPGDSSEGSVFIRNVKAKGACRLCGDIGATFNCERCGVVKYCNKQCQQRDVQSHEAACAKLRARPQPKSRRTDPPVSFLKSTGERETTSRRCLCGGQCT